MSILLNKDIRDLINAYGQISDPKLAKNVLNLVLSMVPKNEKETENNFDTPPDYIKEYQKD